MASVSFNQRLEDLTEHIAKDQNLLKEVEDALRVEGDPIRRAKYQRDVEQLKESAHRYRQQYDVLNHQTTAEMETVAEQLRQMDWKLDSVLGGQVAIAQQLSQMQHTLLSRYDQTERSLVAAVVEKLDDRQLSMTQTFLDTLDSRQLAESEIEEMWAVLEERLPELPPSQDAVKEWVRAPGLDARHRLKVTLPIVPLLVDYEAEFELNGGLDFKGLWETLKAKLRKPKVQATYKPVWQVAREIRQGLSDDDLRRLPSDGAVNHDHYIYGTPKIDS
jgi:hypothetical protein